MFNLLPSLFLSRFATFSPLCRGEINDLWAGVCVFAVIIWHVIALKGEQNVC